MFRKRGLAAALISAALFAGLHLQVALLIPIAIVGVILAFAWLFLSWGTVWTVGQALCDRVPLSGSAREDQEDQESPVHLETYASYAEAELAAQRLEAAGVPSLVRPAGGGGSFGSAALFQQELRVRPTDIERAQQILKASGRHRYRRRRP